MIVGVNSKRATQINPPLFLLLLLGTDKGSFHYYIQRFLFCLANSLIKSIKKLHATRRNYEESPPFASLLSEPSIDYARRWALSQLPPNALS